MSNTLGISWINGALKVAVCHGTSIKGAWEYPDRVDQLDELVPLLRDAIHSTRFTGTDVTIIIDHPHLVYHLQDTPPGTPRTLRPLLQRQISQANFFEEEAVWSHHSPIQGKANQRFLLTLLPRSIMDGLTDVCVQLGLTLIGVYSPAAVLARQFKCLQMNSSEAILLAADLEGKLCLVAGKADGTLLFCRHISGATSQDQDRAAQEINRTLLFIQQKFGYTIHGLWVFGHSFFNTLSQFKIREGMVIRQSPVEESPLYLNSACANLSPLNSENLVSGQETRRRRLHHFLSIAAVCLITLGLGSTLTVNKVVQAREAGMQQWTRSWNRLEQQHDQLLFRQREVMLLEEKLNQLGSPDDPPLVELFVRYLGTALPDSVTLTGLSVSQIPSGCEVRLEGFTQDSKTPVLPVLEKLEETLAKGLFKLDITDSTRQQVFGNAPPQTSLPRLDNRGGLPQGQRRFFIVGHWK